MDHDSRQPFAFFGFKCRLCITAHCTRRVDNMARCIKMYACYCPQPTSRQCSKGNAYIKKGQDEHSVRQALFNHVLYSPFHKDEMDSPRAQDLADTAELHVWYVDEEETRLLDVTEPGAASKAGPPPVPARIPRTPSVPRERLQAEREVRQHTEREERHHTERETRHRDKSHRDKSHRERRKRSRSRRQETVATIQRQRADEAVAPLVMSGDVIVDRLSPKLILQRIQRKVTTAVNGAKQASLLCTTAATTFAQLAEELESTLDEVTAAASQMP